MNQLKLEKTEQIVIGLVGIGLVGMVVMAIFLVGFISAITTPQAERHSLIEDEYELMFPMGWTPVGCEARVAHSPCRWVCRTPDLQYRTCTPQRFWIEGE